MKITIETIVNAPLATVWAAWNSPEDIKQWNAANDDWCTTMSEVDLRPGGRFAARMAAKDGSHEFTFGGTYEVVEPHQRIEYSLDDGRKVRVEFTEGANRVRVVETFDAETQNSQELQRQGWQAILDNFKKHVEAKS